VHTYKVSPALTLIEKSVTRALARLFGFTGEHAGGISQPGGSASNATSIVVARNTLFPETKTDGHQGRRFALFTSEHGHYSLEKAAQMFGFGSRAVRSVEVDADGRMVPAALDAAVASAKEQGETPFYVNATAGTTVLGSFDPFADVAEVCSRHGLWLHIDGSWGGPVIFSPRLAETRLAGAERADSVGFTPHKMLGVPMTCSFLLVQDTRKLHKANTLPAGYLFHDAHPDQEVYDLADLTPQCGRKGEALKFFVGWKWYGNEGYESMVERAFETAEYLFSLLSEKTDFVMVSKSPLPCLQVCFYYAPGGVLKEGDDENTKATAEVVRRLVTRGFMVDYAPGPRGKFFRVVVGWNKTKSTMEGLVKALEEVGREVVGV